MKKNLDNLCGHLVEILNGGGKKNMNFNGNKLHLNLKIGLLVFSACGTGSSRLGFEAVPIERIVSESYD